MRATSTNERTPYGTVILSDGTPDYKGQIRLNRSRKWDHAFTYQEARDKSPSNEPVR